VEQDYIHLLRERSRRATQLKAIQIRKFGEPADVVKLVDIAPAPRVDGEVRIKVEAAGINPSDVANIRGLFPDTRLPRVVGRDFAGQIVEGPSHLIGQKVWGSGGDIGFTRDGAHAEFIIVPLSAASPRPENLNAEQAAVVGVPFSTAYMSLENARLVPGEWVLISGAAGAVGSAALELVKALGGRTIALVRDKTQSPMLDMSKVEAVATSEPDNIAEVVRAATGGRGVDIALNGVGASVFQPMMASLAEGGRMAVYSVSFGGRDVKVDLFPLYRKRQELIGINSIPLDAVRAAGILTKLVPLFESGRLNPPRVAERYLLADAVKAYERVRSAQGKVAFVIK
jgi:NADPH:quinone reductase